MFQIRLCRSYRFDSCVLSASKIARQARPAGRFPCRHRMMLPMTMANMCRRNSVVLCGSSAKRISASFSCAFCSLYVCLPSRRQSVMLSAWHMTIVRCRRAALIWMSVQFTCVRAMKGLEVQGLSWADSFETASSRPVTRWVTQRWVYFRQPQISCPMHLFHLALSDSYELLHGSSPLKGMHSLALLCVLPRSTRMPDIADKKTFKNCSIEDAFNYV